MIAEGNKKAKRADAPDLHVVREERLDAGEPMATHSMGPLRFNLWQYGIDLSCSSKAGIIGNAYSLLMALARYVNTGDYEVDEQTGEKRRPPGFNTAWPEVETLAKQLGCSRVTIHKRLRKLVACGAITRGRHHRRPGKHNEYRIRPIDDIHAPLTAARSSRPSQHGLDVNVNPWFTFERKPRVYEMVPSDATSFETFEACESGARAEAHPLGHHQVRSQGTARAGNGAKAPVDAVAVDEAPAQPAASPPPLRAVGPTATPPPPPAARIGPRPRRAPTAPTRRLGAPMAVATRVRAIAKRFGFDSNVPSLVTRAGNILADSPMEVDDFCLLLDELAERLAPAIADGSADNPPAYFFGCLEADAVASFRQAAEDICAVYVLAPEDDRAAWAREVQDDAQRLPWVQEMLDQIVDHLEWPRDAWPARRRLWGGVLYAYLDDVPTREGFVDQLFETGWFEQHPYRLNTDLVVNCQNWRSGDTAPPPEPDQHAIAGALKNAWPTLAWPAASQPYLGALTCWVRPDGVLEVQAPDQAHAHIVQTILADVLESVVRRAGGRGWCSAIVPPSSQEGPQTAPSSLTPAACATEARVGAEPALTRRERVEQAQQAHPDWSPEQIAQQTGMPTSEVRAFQRREDEKSAHQRLQAAFVATRTQEDLERALAATEAEQRAGHLRPSAYKALVERNAPAARKRVTVLAARAQHPAARGEEIAVITGLPYHIVRTHLVADGSLHPVVTQGAGA